MGTHHSERSVPKRSVPSCLCDLTLKELSDWVLSQGQPEYRARQIFHSLYRRPPILPEKMSNLPADFRQLLRSRFRSLALTPVETQRSADGTCKILSKLPDGQFLETVMIPAQNRRTVCVSTQVGCAYGCAFCASGQFGLKRNLSTGEIIQQILLAERELSGGRVTNVVFMGMGEPLSNYENVMKAIRILNAPEGLQIGVRKITLSTVGVVPMIERLAKEGLQIELSISLHAPTDPLRTTLMPVNRKYPLSVLIPSAKAYAAATKRLITFEYILIDQVNDGGNRAQELARLLKGVLCKVNLIPCHPTPGTPWARPAQERMLSFERTLRRNGIPCTLRRSRGLDIEGACGQLRLRHEAAQ